MLIYEEKHVYVKENLKMKKRGVRKITFAMGYYCTFFQIVFLDF